MSEQIENQRVIGLIEDYLEEAKGKGFVWSDKRISLIYRIGETNLYEVCLIGGYASLIFEVNEDGNEIHFAAEELLYQADLASPEDSHEYLNDLSGYNQALAWEQAREAAQISDAEIEQLAEEAFEAALGEPTTEQVLHATLLLQNDGLLTPSEAQRIREDHRYRLMPPEEEPLIPWEVEYAETAWQMEHPVEE